MTPVPCPLPSALCPLLPPKAAESVFFDWDLRSTEVSVGRLGTVPEGVGPGGELPESSLFTRYLSYPRVATRAVHLHMHRPAPGCFAKCSAGAGVETGAG